MPSRVYAVPQDSGTNPLNGTPEDLKKLSVAMYTTINQSINTEMPTAIG